MANFAKKISEKIHQKFFNSNNFFSKARSPKISKRSSGRMSKTIYLIIGVLSGTFVFRFLESQFLQISQVFLGFSVFFMIGVLSSFVLVDLLEKFCFEPEWDKEQVGSEMRVLSSGITSSYHQSSTNKRLFAPFPLSKRKIPISVLF